MPIRLALSVHAADDALRSQLMPVNDRYPLEDVLAACRAYHARSAPGVRRVRDAGRGQRSLRAGARTRRAPGPARVQGQPDPLQPHRGLRGSRREAIGAFREALRSAGSRPRSASPAGATSTPPAGSWLPPRPAHLSPSRPTRAGVAHMASEPASGAAPRSQRDRSSARDSPPVEMGLGAVLASSRDRRHHRRGPMPTIGVILAILGWAAC